jgi:hypothetical protein
MKSLLSLSLGVILLVAGCSEALTEAEGDAAPNAAAEMHESTAEFEVVIRNVTRGQPFTPPLVATHNEQADLFSVGEAASFGLKEIAENGNLDPLIGALTSDVNVSDVVVAVAGDPPPVMPGSEVRFTMTAGHGSKYISFASMLICTNDGFTGIDAAMLPRNVGEYEHFNLNAYDAGTEVNTEDFVDIVPPCQALVGISSDDPGTGESNPDLAENGTIMMHDGIEGGVDLVPEVHGWRNPVARVRVRRMR